MNSTEEWNSWFAGLCDGEACFLIDGRGSARLEITLRADDKYLLDEIQAELGVGSVIRQERLRQNWNPSYRYRVYGKKCEIVAERLRGRMRSKKSRDFALWDAALQEAKALPGKTNPERKQLMLRYKNLIHQSKQFVE